jgi:hypothetical protein
MYHSHIDVGDEKTRALRADDAEHSGDVVRTPNARLALRTVHEPHAILLNYHQAVVQQRVRPLLSADRSDDLPFLVLCGMNNAHFERTMREEKCK